MPHFSIHPAHRKSMSDVRAYMKGDDTRLIGAVFAMPASFGEESELSRSGSESTTYTHHQRERAQHRASYHGLDEKRDSRVDSTSSLEALSREVSSTNSAYTSSEVSSEMSSRRQARQVRDSSYSRDTTDTTTTTTTVSPAHTDSPVLAELRTNVIVDDEYTLVTELSAQLAHRYHRAESSILVTVAHSTCFVLGGSFEPAYLLTITAVPTQLRPAANKRNAALVQACLADVLAVPADRGIVRFAAIDDASLATNGTTVAGESERLARLHRSTTESRRRKSLRSSLRGPAAASMPALSGDGSRQEQARVVRRSRPVLVSRNDFQPSSSAASLDGHSETPTAAETSMERWARPSHIPRPLLPTPTPTPPSASGHGVRGWLEYEYSPSNSTEEGTRIDGDGEGVGDGCYELPADEAAHKRIDSLEVRGMVEEATWMRGEPQAPESGDEWPVTPPTQSFGRGSVTERGHVPEVPPLPPVVAGDRPGKLTQRRKSLLAAFRR